MFSLFSYFLFPVYVCFLVNCWDHLPIVNWIMLFSYYWVFIVVGLLWILVIYHMCGAVLSCPVVWLFVTLWTAAHQAPLSMGILWARILEWVAYPSPGNLPNPGIEPGSPALQADSTSWATMKPHLSHKWFANIFSSPVTWFIILLTLSFSEEAFSINEVKLYLFSFIDLVFVVWKLIIKAKVT